jgi:hypothetical protein
MLRFQSTQDDSIRTINTGLRVLNEQFRSRDAQIVVVPDDNREQVPARVIIQDIESLLRDRKHIG